MKSMSLLNIIDGIIDVIIKQINECLHLNC